MGKKRDGTEECILYILFLDGVKITKQRIQCKSLSLIFGEKAIFGILETPALKHFVFLFIYMVYFSKIEQILGL